MKQFKLSMIIATIAFSISSCSNKRQAQTEPEAIAPFNISKAEMLSDKCDTITAPLSQEDYALMIDLIESGITELTPTLKEIVESKSQEEAITAYSQNSELTDKIDYISSFWDYAANGELSNENRNRLNGLSEKYAEFDRMMTEISDLVYNKYELY